MESTTSTNVAAFPPPPAESEDAAAIAVIAASAGDAVDPDNDFYQELLELQSASTPEILFADDSELFASEQLEQSGVPRPVPWRPSARTMIAHQTRSTEKRERLELAFREKHKIPLGQPLSAKVREALWRESFYGTVVVGWEGYVLHGEPVPFTAENLRLYMKSRRYRQYVLSESNNAETFRAARTADLRGNS